MAIGEVFRRLLRQRRPQAEARDFDSGVDVEFDKLESRQLKPLAVVAQCLDNQWVPQDLLRKMLKKGLSLKSEQVAESRLTDARAEYLRALLNAEQVIINRAFFFNNPVVYNDFLEAGSVGRETFKNMLNTSVIVPFLYLESSPGQLPEFEVDPVGWAAWKQLLPETNPKCVRISWDENNPRYVQDQLERRFADFVTSLAHMDVDGLSRDLELDAERTAAFVRHLKKVSAWGVDERRTRNQVYKEFIVAKGTNPADGRYDPRKPFVAELKQLIDLRYNTNLPDALDRYPITPIESLHRTALQEIPRRPPGDDFADPKELAGRLLQRTAFDLIQGSLSVPLTGLDLNHVWQARQTDEWHTYVRDLQALMGSPLEFGDRGQAVYTSYVRLAERLAQIVGDRQVPWAPTAELVIEALGATISIVFRDNPVATVVGQVAQTVAPRISTAVVRFVVGGYNRRVARHQLATGVELMRVRFERTGPDWEELIGRLAERGVAVRRLPSETDTVDDPTIDGLDPQEDEG